MLNLRDARVYTGRRWAEALVIDDAGRVASTEAGPAAGPVWQLEGRVVVPGLIDAHLHLLHMAQAQRGLRIEAGDPPAAILSRLRSEAAKLAPGTWILGTGYDDSQWAESLNRAALDSVTRRHPVFLQRKDLHSGVANSAALEAAGLSDASRAPAGGRLDRDPRGLLTGVLREKAREPVFEALPPLTEEELEHELSELLGRLATVGLTTVCSIGDWAEFQALNRLQARRLLRIRVAQLIGSGELERVVGEGLRSGDGDDRLWFSGIKYFADGSLGSRTALLEEPYQGSDDCGVAAVDPHALAEGVKRANQAGISAAIHAIGDRALRTALDAIEAALPHSRGVDRIEHVQLGSPESFRRMAAMDVIASMQPLHAVKDRSLAERWWGERCRFAYAWQSLLKAGVTLAFGSDAPVESADPLAGIRSAVSRQDEDGLPEGGWYPAQRLTLEAALQAYGVGAARALQQPQLGLLEPGSPADCVVLDDTPDRASARVHAVLVEGEPIVGGPP
jgi:predicted amidohydrolase YtcJ